MVDMIHANMSAHLFISPNIVLLSVMELLQTISVQERYKNAVITLNLAKWDDGTVSIHTIHYIRDASEIGNVSAPSGVSRILPNLEAAIDAGMARAKQEIDRVAA